MRVRTVLVVLVIHCGSVCALGGWGQPADVFLRGPASAETIRSVSASGIARCDGALRVTGGELKRIAGKAGAGVEALRGGGDEPRDAVGRDAGGRGAGGRGDETTNERLQGMALEFVKVWYEEAYQDPHENRIRKVVLNKLDAVDQILYGVQGSTDGPQEHSSSRGESMSGQVEGMDAARQAKFRVQLATQIRELSGKEPRWELQKNGDYAIYEE